MFWSTAMFQRKIVRMMMTKTVTTMMLTMMKMRNQLWERPLSLTLASTQPLVTSKENRREICLFRWSTLAVPSHLTKCLKWVQLEMQPKHSCRYPPTTSSTTVLMQLSCIFHNCTVGRVKFLYEKQWKIIGKEKNTVSVLTKRNCLQSIQWKDCFSSSNFFLHLKSLILLHLLTEEGAFALQIICPWSCRYNES